MRGAALLQPRCSGWGQSALQPLQHQRRGDLHATGLSNRLELVWIPVEAVTLQSNKSGQAVGTTGQTDTKGWAVPKRAAPKWKYRELMWNLSEFSQVNAVCHAAARLVFCYQQPVAKVYSLVKKQAEKKSIFPSKFSLVTYTGQSFGCLPWWWAFHQQARSQALELRLNEELGILQSGFGKNEVPKRQSQAATTALDVPKGFRHFAFPLVLQKVPGTEPHAWSCPVWRCSTPSRCLSPAGFWEWATPPILSDSSRHPVPALEAHLRRQDQAPHKTQLHWFFK